MPVAVCCAPVIPRSDCRCSAPIAASSSWVIPPVASVVKRASSPGGSAEPALTACSLDVVSTPAAARFFTAPSPSRRTAVIAIAPSRRRRVAAARAVAVIVGVTVALARVSPSLA